MMVVFDWDGTVCLTPDGANFDDADSLLASCQPNQAVVARVEEAVALGHRIAVVTGRGPHVAHATRAQAAAWLPGVDVTLVHRPRLVFDWRHYVADKEHSLRELGADVYVGDRAEDKAAALRAGVRFLWHHEFARHGLTALRTVPA